MASNNNTPDVVLHQADLGQGLVARDVRRNNRIIRQYVNVAGEVEERDVTPQIAPDDALPMPSPDDMGEVSYGIAKTQIECGNSPRLNPVVKAQLDSIGQLPGTLAQFQAEERARALRATFPLTKQERAAVNAVVSRQRAIARGIARFAANQRLSAAAYGFVASGIFLATSIGRAIRALVVGK